MNIFMAIINVPVIFVGYVCGGIGYAIYTSARRGWSDMQDGIKAIVGE